MPDVANQLQAIPQYAGNDLSAGEKHSTDPTHAISDAPADHPRSVVEALGSQYTGEVSKLVHIQLLTATLASSRDRLRSTSLFIHGMTSSSK